ncbi:MAG: hypothetical protein ACYS26_15380 [Planctomycetota bacterium]
MLAVLVVGIAGYLWTQELPREIQLKFGDGAPVEGAEVRWFAPPDRVGSAEDLGGGRYAVNGRALALEIRGAERGRPWIADSLAWIPEGRDVVRVWRRGSAAIDVYWHGLVGAAAHAEIVLFTPETKGNPPSPEIDPAMFAKGYFDEDFRAEGVVDLRFLFRGERPSTGFSEWLTDKVVARLAEEAKGWIPAELDQVRATVSPSSYVHGDLLEFDRVPVGLVFRAGAAQRSSEVQPWGIESGDAYQEVGFTEAFTPFPIPDTRHFEHDWVPDFPSLRFKAD